MTVQAVTVLERTQIETFVLPFSRVAFYVEYRWSLLVYHVIISARTRCVV